MGRVAIRSGADFEQHHHREQDDAEHEDEAGEQIVDELVHAAGGQHAVARDIHRDAGVSEDLGRSVLQLGLGLDELPAAGVTGERDDARPCPIGRQDRIQRQLAAHLGQENLLCRRRAGLWPPVLARQ